MKALLKSGKVVDKTDGLKESDILLVGTEDEINLYLTCKAKVNSRTSWWIYSYLLDTRLPEYAIYSEHISAIVNKLTEYKSGLGAIADLSLDAGHDVYTLYQLVWEIMPDHPKIHDLPMWDILCDLCAEEYLVTEEPGYLGEH